MPYLAAAGSARLRTRGVLLSLLVPTAVLGTAIATAPHAQAVPPFHCKASPNGQDCTNGGDKGGGPWAPPDYYVYYGSVAGGAYEEYVRSDGLMPTDMDLQTVQAATGASVCVHGTYTGHGPGPWIDCR